ncbi:thiaminase II [Microlunatus elymi]|uniref:Thiaminase II n=1 Tax=Microlunatus elymi TaxID=2596828 RepID=A0A516PYQ7_9ACTN|nr:TenA family protein [Microlunatus elymi]QDP96303.1 thiaminase II [Microlunatus elymi]
MSVSARLDLIDDEHTPDGFSATAWQAVAGWFAAITEHPFIRQLADGSLPEVVFARYLLDDAHYLKGYASALASLSARSGDPEARLMLAASAASAIEAERSMHRQFLLPRNIDPDAPSSPDPKAVAEPSPTCVGYVESLRAASVLEPLGVGMAAVLPCFRVYAEVGSWIVANTGDSRPDHPYRTWIDTYADPAFAAAVGAAEAYADRLAVRAGADERAAMLAAYRRATRYEYMFWDAAWQDQRWPQP